MPRTVLEIRDLSKLYRLGEIGTGTLSHDLNRWWARMRGKEDPFSLVGQVNRREKASVSKFVWALKDLSCEVQEGDIVGIIGANGSGKSTLLKLISRITAPTTGSIRVRGRLASLLEVGTGMHPEMTARENVYLNGAILGMRRHEITRKFDDIVDFAGCRMYVDTPVKRFSSGMRVRLGFAVAAFLEPEILIVDEVLAVGDAEFQRRALNRIQELRTSQGRTILYVSHNLATVEEICSRAMLLEHGRIKLQGTTSQVISEYLRGRDLQTSSRWTLPQGPISKPTMLDAKITKCTENRFGFGDTLTLEVSAVSPELRYVALEIIIKDQCQYPVIFLPSGLRFAKEFLLTPHQPETLRCTIPSLPLAVGTYTIDLLLTCSATRIWDQRASALSFEVTHSDPCRTGRQFLQSNQQGCVHIPAIFEDVAAKPHPG